MRTLAVIMSITVSAVAGVRAGEWELVWSDEFDYQGLPDKTKWAYEEGFVRNSESQYYTRDRLENGRVENGTLVIECRKEAFKPATNQTVQYTSASLITLNKADWRYGRIEVRAKLPEGKGVWPAIWTLGTNMSSVNWPTCGEIDIMEFIGKEPDKVHATVHYAADGKHQMNGTNLVTNKPYADFHVFSVEWDANRLDFFFDDRKYHTFPIDKAGAGDDDPFRKPHYLLLNFALGGTWGGPFDDAILPQKFLIDYVRVYRQGTHTAAKAKDEYDPIARTEVSQDVAWLERIAGSLEEASKMKPHGGLGGLPKDLRTAAYARLGALGTPESLAAVDRIESKAKMTTACSHPIRMGLWTHPCWHFSDSDIEPLAQTKAVNGRTYAVIRSPHLGGPDLFLTSTTEPEKNRWARPILVPAVEDRNMRDPSLASPGDGILVLSYTQEEPVSRHVTEESPGPGQRSPQPAKREIEISVAQTLKDSDGDGWTDAEEARLGTDVQKSDTDGDGIKDGDDPTPNYGPEPGDERQDEVAAIQKAIFATFGLTDSHHLVIVGGKSRKVQVWGYSGPIIYGKDRDTWRKEHKYGWIFADWQAMREGNTIRVRISDWEGMTASGSQLVILEKKHGKWVVVRRELGPVG